MTAQRSSGLLSSARTHRQTDPSQTYGAAHFCSAHRSPGPSHWPTLRPADMPQRAAASTMAIVSIFDVGSKVVRVCVFVFMRKYHLLCRLRCQRTRCNTQSVDALRQTRTGLCLPGPKASFSIETQIFVKINLNLFENNENMQNLRPV